MWAVHNKNHMMAECSTHLYCDICDAHDEHMNHRCLVLKMPKPVVHAVGFAVEGLGFYHIPHPPLSEKRDAKTALIKVVGRSLSSVQLVTQLQEVVPGRWKWEPVAQYDGSFVVEFPSKAQLRTSINYGSMGIRENGISTGSCLEFEEWHDKDEGFLLPKVWVRVSGIRKALMEYLNLWAILGATQVVDMKTTRKNDFGRINMTVLDPKLLPKELDVVIGDRYFELKFEIEKKGVDENGYEIEWGEMEMIRGWKKAQMEMKILQTESPSIHAMRTPLWRMVRHLINQVVKHLMILQYIQTRRWRREFRPWPRILLIGLVTKC